MRAPNPRQWWTLLAVALAIVIVWPPQGDKSLGLKFVNWAVDPLNRLPVLPPQLRVDTDPSRSEGRSRSRFPGDHATAAGGRRGDPHHDRLAHGEPDGMRRPPCEGWSPLRF
jgi:hypothetical protein